MFHLIYFPKQFTEMDTKKIGSLHHFGTINLQKYTKYADKLNFIFFIYLTDTITFLVWTHI